MSQALGHRGPDAQGLFVDPAAGLGLGHRRLSILELSPQGAQPMHSRDGRYVLIHNGEIYNFPDLRKELETEGGADWLPWRGGSDTEVMLAAFARHGVEKACKRFSGMFAFALWDREEKALWLARDRMGEKPLYYGVQNGTLFFGSELKALCAHPAFRPELDRDALPLYLRNLYIPAPRSIYKDVLKLPAGTFLRLEAGSLPAMPEPKAYWSLREAVEAGLGDPFTGSEEQAATRLETLLLRTVKGQMISDVPLGALLSGGIDSSLVAALMQASSQTPVRTFTIGFHEREYDEASDARRVAKYLGTEHTEMFVRPKDALDVIPSLPTLYDEPFSDASQIPTFLVSRLTRQHVTVCLSGDGGDETFAGYNRHFWGRDLWNKFGPLPAFLRTLLGAGIKTLPPGTWDFLFKSLSPILPQDVCQRTPGYKMHKLAEVISAPDRRSLYKRLISNWPDPAIVCLSGTEPETLFERPDKWPKTKDFTQWMQFMDTAVYLPDDIMVKVDRAAMGVSLETRAPYLDHEVVEFAWRLPLSMKIRGREGKRILKKILYRHVPRILVDRPKMGFGVPIDQWLRGPLKEWACDLLSRETLNRQGYFNPDPIQAALDEHLSGRRDHQYRLWNILMFQAWLEGRSGL